MQSLFGASTPTRIRMPQQEGQDVGEPQYDQNDGDDD